MERHWRENLDEYERKPDRQDGERETSRDDRKRESNRLREERDEVRRQGRHSPPLPISAVAHPTAVDLKRRSLSSVSSPPPVAAIALLANNPERRHAGGSWGQARKFSSFTITFKIMIFVQRIEGHTVLSISLVLINFVQRIRIT